MGDTPDPEFVCIHCGAPIAHGCEHVLSALGYRPASPMVKTNTTNTTNPWPASFWGHPSAGVDEAIVASEVPEGIATLEAMLAYEAGESA